MNLDRRRVLRVAALGAVSPLAGCLDDGGLGDGDGTPTETPTGTPGETPTDTPGGAGPSIAGDESLGFTVRGSAPEWYDDDEPRGHAVAIDSESRQRAALEGYDLSEEREAEVEDFLEDVDYGTDRLVLLESVGPDTCHSRLDVSDVRVEDGALAAGATVVDTSEADEACGDAITFPSTLLAVTFEDDPLDEVRVAFTDGWDETATVTAGVDDPLPAREPEEQPGYVRPDSESEPVASLACDDDDGVRRHDQWYDESAVQWGDFADADHGDGEAYLSLRVDDLEYEYGDTARIELTNVADEPVETGNRHKFNLQVYTEDGWQDVRVRDDGGHFGYTDEAIEHQPGEGFTWTVELTESGVIDAGTYDDARVCPDLQSGRYRFAYFGVIGDGAVAVSFDLTV